MILHAIVALIWALLFLGALASIAGTVRDYLPAILQALKG